MAAVINTNMASLQAQNQLSRTTASLNNTIQQLSSGLRVSSSKDDASGYSIAKGMDATIRGSNQSIRNINDAISLTQTTSGALETLSDLMGRMRELAVQANNDSNTVNGGYLDKEFKALAAESLRVIAATKFNGVATFTATAFAFRVSSVTADAALSLTPTAMTAVAAASASTVGIASTATAATTLALIDTAVTEIGTVGAELGAFQSRLTFAQDFLKDLVENTSAAKSRIVDTDFAAQTAELSKYQILQQAGTAMLAQANQMGSNVLTLLK
jgi:flagellin